jgi:gliding motility-associated-like protein
MQRKLLIFPFLIFVYTFLIAQAPTEKEFDYRYGGDEYEELHKMYQYPSGEIILFGESSSDAEGDKSQDAYEAFPGVNSGDFWIMKLDEFGVKIWDYRYGGAQQEIGIDMIPLADGSIILAGVSSSGISGERSQACWGYLDYWMIKIDAAGNKLWDKRFGTNSADYFTEIIQTQDGGFVLGGYTEGGISGDKTETAWDIGAYEYDYWIVKTDASGNKLWDKRYGGTEYEQMDGLVELADGSLMLGGHSGSGINGDKTAPQAGLGDYWVVKTDANGNYIWDKKYGGNLEEKFYDMIVDSDNNVLLGGYSRSDDGGDKTDDAYNDVTYGNTSDFWIVKIDADGNILWDNVYGGINFEDEFGNILQTSDGGYLFTGNSYSPISGEKSENNLGEEQMWTIKTDINGVVLWDKTLLNGGHDEIGLGLELNDGCYLFGTQTYSPAVGYKSQPAYEFLTDDLWIVKFCDTTALGPIAEFTIEEDTICAETCIPFVYAGTGATSYSWSFDGGTPNTSTDTEPIICYNAEGSFNVTLIVTNDVGSDTISVNDLITVLPSAQQVNLPPTATLCSGDELILDSGNENALWNDGTIGNTILITVPGIYWAVDSNNCGIFSDTTYVVEQQCNCLILVPNAFSPNEDGINDKFRLMPTCEIDLTLLQIYNRWGQLVYETNDIDAPWDGTFGNKMQPVGTYVYTVKYGNMNGDQFEDGNITLIR